jgi:tRNA-specific 2-thiouridylase
MRSISVNEAKMKVVIAMSGGVDSSVAAAILKEEGHDVIGITMRLWPRSVDDNSNKSSSVCCGLDAIEDARRVADKLKTPHYVMDLSDVFTEMVVDDFCNEYNMGRTPNPCIRCNRYVKFGALMEKANEIGADLIATGHHARIEPDEKSDTLLLKKGSDTKKDQSYFLCQLTQKQLSRTIFPIGNLTKDKVREIAHELKLPIADKPESQEICFIPDDNYAEFINNYIPIKSEPGPILDEQGNLRGEHRGLMFYTVGQRKGLGITATKPLYVTAIEPERNAVIVGSRDRTFGRELVASNLNWIAGTAPRQPISVKARIRYRHKEASATVTPLANGDVHVQFIKPQMAITPGQATVFYDGDMVIGGGTIIRQGS